MKALNRREFLRLSSVVTTGVFLAACAPAAAPTTVPTAAPKVVASPSAAPKAATAKTTITFQDWGGDFATLVTDVGAPKFKEINPNTEIKYEPYAAGWEEKTLAAMVAGTSPDILHCYSDLWARFGERGQFIDLADLFAKDFTKEQIADFWEFQWKNLVLPGNGMRVGIPKHLWVNILIYNKQAFDEAGQAYPNADWTYDTYRAAAKKLTKKTGATTMFGGHITVLARDRVWPYIRGWGGHLADPNDRTKCLLGEKPAQDALEWLRSCMWDENIIAQPLQVEKMTEYDALNSGRAAMIDAGSTLLYTVMKQMPQKWDIAHMPKGPDHRSGLGTTNGYGIYKGVKDRKSLDAAWEFGKFTISPWWQEKVLMESTSRACVPGLKSLVPLFNKILRTKEPKLQQINLEVITEAASMGYLETDTSELFKNDPAAMEIYKPAMDRIFLTGKEPVSIFKNSVAKEISDSQK